MEQQKKVVEYSSAQRIIPGLSAFVVAVNHPDEARVTNGELVITSTVTAYDETTGIFETLNTVYVPQGTTDEVLPQGKS